MEEQNLIRKIEELKKQRKAVILAHTYQPSEIQSIADYVGDSYGLSVKASQLEDAQVILFCGVRFMAETAAILNPGKTILLPDETAGCPMAEMISADELREFKKRYPGAPVVCYVNSTAEVKAESTVCCTSSNAVRILDAFKDSADILFVPDQYLGKFAEQKLKRGLVLWHGCCPIHHELTPAHIQAARRLHPDAKVMVHPETKPETQNEADYVLSTGEMLDLVKKTDETSFIVGTECGIMSALKLAAPHKNFYSVEPELVCHDMKKITLEKVLETLQNMAPQVHVSPQVAEKALLSIKKMLEISQK